MACDAATLLAAAVANGYYKLSQRDTLMGIAYEYAQGAGTTIEAAFDVGVTTNKYQGLSEEDLLQCWLAASCASGCDATTIYAAAVSNGMPKLSDRDLWLVILSSVCSGGGGSCDAASVELGTMATGKGEKYGERSLLESIVSSACASGCTAAALVATSQTTDGYAKLSKRMILECLAYELCTNPPGNLIPPGATCAAGSYTLNVKANSTYQITWGSETSVTLCGITYPSPGVGGITVVTTGACLTMVFACGVGAITTIVRPSSKTPTPGNFTWVMNLPTSTDASWGTVPGFVERTELWTSTDGITYSLAATVAAPGTTASVAAPAAGQTLYAKVRFIDDQASPTAGPFSAPLSVTRSTLASGLANYWEEEEAGAANRIDQIGGITLIATGCTSIAGKHNNATSSNAGAGSCGNGANSLRVTAGSSVTFSLWFNMVANPADFRAVQGMWPGVTKITLFLWFAGSTTLKLTADNAAGSAQANLTVAAPPTTGVWHHIVFGYDDAAQQIWHCYDGAARVSVASAGVWNGDPGPVLDYRQLAYLGGSGPINGAIDEVGRWTRVLTPAECTSLWNSGAGTFYPF